MSTVCIAVARGIPCLGPVTHAGCGALCPAYDRGCYGCFGPREGANAIGLARHLLSDPGSDGEGHSALEVGRLFAGFTAYQEPFRGVVSGLGGTRTSPVAPAVVTPTGVPADAERVDRRGVQPCMTRSCHRAPRSTPCSMSGSSPGSRAKARSTSTSPTAR